MPIIDNNWPQVNTASAQQPSSCSGMGQCQKDVAISEARRATLGEAGGTAQAIPYAAEAETFREYQRSMEAQVRANAAHRAVRERIAFGQQAVDDHLAHVKAQTDLAASFKNGGLSEHEQRAMHGERLFRRSEVLAVVLGVQDDLRTKGIHLAGLLAVDAVIRAVADME